jgi:hypothetical protein
MHRLSANPDSPIVPRTDPSSRRCGSGNLALHPLGQPVLDGEIALYVKLGVLAMAEYWWFTGINHRVTERTEDERTENDYLHGYRIYLFSKCW